jgi:hypothetical protein
MHSIFSLISLRNQRREKIKPKILFGIGRIDDIETMEESKDNSKEELVTESRKNLDEIVPTLLYIFGHDCKTIFKNNVFCPGCDNYDKFTCLQAKTRP